MPTYITIAADLETLQKLGYKINLPITASVEFINTHFANLNLRSLALITESKLVYLKNQSSELVRTIYLEYNPEPKLTFTLLREDFSDPKNDMGLIRAFYHQASEVIVEHLWFVIPEVNRSRGIARLIFRNWVQQYQSMGVSKIKVSTGLTDGGYVWAKNFFTADNRNEMDIILEKAKSLLNDTQFKAVQTLYDLYYISNPNGNAFPIIEWASLPFMVLILRGSYWEGTMDFNNTDQIANFITYINK